MPTHNQKILERNGNKPSFNAGQLLVVRIKTLLCVGCGECAAICKHGVFARTADGKKVEIKNAERCKGCHKCIGVCRTKAVHIVPGKGIRNTMVRS